MTVKPAHNITSFSLFAHSSKFQSQRVLRFAVPYPLVNRRKSLCPDVWLAEPILQCNTHSCIVVFPVNRQTSSQNIYFSYLLLFWNWFLTILLSQTALFSVCFISSCTHLPASRPPARPPVCLSAYFCSALQFRRVFLFRNWISLWVRFSGFIYTNTSQSNWMRSHAVSDKIYVTVLVTYPVDIFEWFWTRK